MAPIRHRILVVEDSDAMRSLIASTCESLPGVEVVEAESGYAALKVLPRERFALVITDINMPDINGLDLIRYVRQSPVHENVPLVIISTESTERDRAKGLDLGATAYVTKPFDPDELLELVRTLLKAG